MSVQPTAQPSFFARHRNKFLYTLGTLSTLYLGGQWVSSKLSEMNERASLERTARENLRKRFEQNQADVGFTTMALLPDLGEKLLTELNVEGLTARLQQKRAPTTPADGEPTADPEAEKRDKLALWNDLKTMSFTRTVSSVYLVTLLSLLTNLQLNLLGRFIYLDSVLTIDAGTSAPVVSMADFDSEKPSLDPATERQYLLFSSYLLTTGWTALVSRVRVAVEESVGNLGLRQPVTYDDLITYIENIRAKVEVEEAPSSEAFGRGVSGSSSIPRGFPHSFESYLLPAPGSDEELEVLRTATHNPDEQMSGNLAGLLETSHRLLSARDFAAVLRGALDDGFEILLKSLKTPTFFPDSFPGPQHGLREMSEQESETASSGPTGEEKSQSPPLASILPPLTRQVHSVIHSGAGNEYLRAIEGNVGVKGWAAVVYAGWGDGF